MGQSPSAADAAGESAKAPAVSLTDAAVDALLRAADSLGSDEALNFEGLRVARTEDGYAFEAGDESWSGLDEAAFRDVAADYAAVVSNWHFWESVVGDAGPRRSYLYWLETGAYPGESPPEQRGVDAASAVRDRYAALAAGVQREWGQLLITVTLADDGTRRYEVRHADEAGADRADLDVHDRPQDARRLVKFDDDGRYRPLKTAPSLPTGWAFADLDQRDAYETVETIYPATVANWDRERRGELDVSHWHETMQRQTGMYGLIETWDRQEGHEHVEWVAEACCDDSQCVKRREWQYDADTELEADGGDGEFPCREPCSVVVSAARKWTKLEAEAERTYEFELTPSEKEQVEEIIDAVADGRTEEIREADLGEGANRYRARFLRAKRFDEDGNLGGVPTDPDVDE
ncbi:DR2241 family protein [Haloparvum sp. AD34]